MIRNIRSAQEKRKSFFAALLNAPKGLSGENPNFYEGQLSVKWRSDCFEDELALTTAWACTNEDPEYQNGCFHHAESFLKTAYEKCAPAETGIAWSWNDSRLAARLILAKFNQGRENFKSLMGDLNYIVKNKDKICKSGDVRLIGNAASLLAMGNTLDQLDDSTKKIFGRTVERLLNCAKSKMIGFSTRDLTAKFHKNSRQFGATLWGAVLDDDGHTNLSTAFELMLAAALK